MYDMYNIRKTLKWEANALKLMKNVWYHHHYRTGKRKHKGTYLLKTVSQNQ